MEKLKQKWRIEAFFYRKYKHIRPLKPQKEVK